MSADVLDAPKVRKAAYDVACCPRCGKPIDKGMFIEMWEDPTRFGKGRFRWSHASEECRLAAAGRAGGGDGDGGGVNLDAVKALLDERLADVKAGGGDPAAVQQLVREQVAQAFKEVDLSGIDEVLQQKLSTVEEQVMAKVTDVCLRLGEAHAISAKETVETVTAAMSQTLQRVTEIVESGVPVVHEVKLPSGETRKSKKGDHYHPAFDEALTLISIGENVFLPGPAGCGKSKMARQIAETLDRPFRFISCSAGMSEGQIKGRLVPTPTTRNNVLDHFRHFVGEGVEHAAAATMAAAMSAGFSYVLAEFVAAYETGCVFLLDEVDAADSNMLLTINDALASGQMAVPNRPEKPYADKHPDFVCIAAANTFGRGADRLYVGRAQLDEAFLDRFRMGVIPMDYDRKLEQWFVNQLSKDDGLRDRGMTILKEVWRIRDEAAKNRLQRVVSSRFVEKMVKVLQVGKDQSYIVSKLTAGWSADEKKKCGIDV